MTPLDKRHSNAEWRESARGSAAESDRIVAFDPATLDSRATRVAESHEMEALQLEVTSLERLARLLQKDVVVKDEYLAVLRTELLTKESEIAWLHDSIAQTLSQPRYRAADALNRALHRVAFLHKLLKRWSVGEEGPDRPTSSSPR